MSHNTTRRSVLGSIGVAGLGLATMQSVSATETDRYIVTGGNADQIEGSGFTVEHELEHAGVFIVTGDADAADDLRNVPGVQGAAPDATYDVGPVEPVDGSDEAVDPADQWDKQLIDAFEAHEYATGDGTSIGIIDTGVAGGHPDIEANFDEDRSASFIDGEQGHTWDDRGYHGTHVAGIAAASGDNGLYGVAPEADIVSLRVFPDEGGAPISDSFLALDYAADQGLDVVNMSIGSPPEPPQYNRNARDGWRIARQHVVQSVVQRGTTVVTSAGNDATNLQQGGWVSLWGSLPSTISVSATDIDDELADFSNYGNPAIDVGAPGESILSAIPEDFDFDGLYGSASGTSMSSPQTAGLAALVCEQHPNANPQQVEATIKQNADLVDGQSDPELGAGRINALSTVED